MIVNYDTQTLAAYVVSQILVDNMEAVQLRLREANKGQIKYQWIHKANQPVSNKIKWLFPLKWSYCYPLY